MERYPLSELKLVYRVLHRHLAQHTELMDARCFDDLQRYLQRQAQAEGVDATDHGAWDAWLGNEVVPCEKRMERRLQPQLTTPSARNSPMLTLKLPDGSARQVAAGTRPRDVAESIGKRLAQAAVAAKVDGAVVDLDRELPAGDGEVAFQILTDKDPEALDVLRHSCAHVMARAVMRLFPGVQLAFGPTIENGFYYDIDSPTPIREEDFPRIEEEMRKIVEDAEPFERFERPTAEARGLVRGPEPGATRSSTSTTT